MATPSYARSLVHSVKRLKLSPNAIPATQCQTRQLQQSSRPAAALSSSLEDELANLRLPLAVQATYLNPLKHEAPKHFEDKNGKIREAPLGSPVCELHLHSYSVRNLDMFTDFALRAAYFLKITASAASLPRKTERWTVPRSNFVHKKSQENFERITMKRRINLYKANPETVAIWLAYLRRHQYYGVGMKANVYEHSDLNAAQDMDKEAERLGEILGQEKLLPKHFKREKKHGPTIRTATLNESFKAQWGGYAAGGAPGVKHASERIEMVKLPPPESEDSVGYRRPVGGHPKAVFRRSDDLNSSD